MLKISAFCLSMIIVTSGNSRCQGTEIQAKLVTKVGTALTSESYIGFIEAVHAACDANLQTELAQLLFVYSASADLKYKKRAFEGLCCIGPKCREFLPDIMTRLNSVDRNTRLYSLKLVRVIGPDAWQCIPVLQNLLKEPDEEIVYHAIGALAAIRHRAAAALPQLNDLVSESRRMGPSRLSIAAVTAILEIDGKSGDLIAVISAGLKDEELVLDCLLAVRKIGREGTCFLPLLTPHLNSNNPLVAECAAKAIGRMGDGASEALPLLHLATMNRSIQVSSAATWAVERILSEQSKKGNNKE